ncbi:MEMO1 family protein [Ferroplasma sp.]|uniref:MEMO1 family protein n=1 Tax=Ferroplasma sp. TaxID=2591003 RepID=UPI00260DBDA0|nr:MEMO1 family protein [Ferroplasma sp.]MCL4453379.1 MEMO1 family protein [Candidatus Thermoplasmatota archaeon]
MDNTRDPYVAGAFYPDDYKQLKNDITSYMDIEPPVLNYKKLIGAIVPHAGYIYSGKTAAYAYSIIKNCKKRDFLIIGPNHSGYPSYPAIYPDGYWNTPMGYARVNSSLSGKILFKSNIIRDDKEAHMIEHSIEVQIPFLQYIFNTNFSFSPIVLGNQGQPIARNIAETIETLEERPFLLISSDLNHYNQYDRNNELDNIIIKDIEDLNVRKYYEDLKKYGISACGYGAIAILMMVTRQMKGKIALLNHSNSGDYGSGHNRVVGYASMIAYK